ncbi:hypothetical protein [Streptomyces sp. NBC_01589]|uniref:hypothetical protein n=1 Tax=unclassified Streptomyces TaxID=2593676 RepID=UPI003865888A
MREQIEEENAIRVLGAKRPRRVHQQRCLPYPGRGGFPPVALIFTKDVGAHARMNRIETIRDLSRTCWQPRWQNPHGWSPKNTEEDGWWDFTGTVPVIATHLDQLRTHGPHGLV